MTTTLETVMSVKKESPGRKYLIRHLQGEKLTLKQAILAKCCDCMGYYIDGKNDCRIPECSLYAWMPYRKDKEKREKSQSRIKTELKMVKFRSGSKSFVKENDVIPPDLTQTSNNERRYAEND